MAFNTMRAPEGKCKKSLGGGNLFRFPREEGKTRTRAVGFLKSLEILLEGLIKIPLGGNFFRFPREEEKTRTRAVGFLKSPEIPLEDTYLTPLHVADWPRVVVVVVVVFPLKTVLTSIQYPGFSFLLFKAKKRISVVTS